MLLVGVSDPMIGNPLPRLGAELSISEFRVLYPRSKLVNSSRRSHRVDFMSKNPKP